MHRKSMGRQFVEEILYDMSPNSRFPSNPIESFRAYFNGLYKKVK